MLITGIDEAGRGAVIGPLIISSVTLPSNKIKDLAKFGVKDSKLLAHKDRIAIAKKIRQIAKVETCHIPATQVDILMQSISLNQIEIEHIASLIKKSNAQSVYVDAIGKNLHKFKKDLRQLSLFKGKITSEYAADKKYLVVGAASIIAKVERERQIQQLHAKHGFFGSGYPSDEKTIQYLKKSLKNLPSIVRKGWWTIKRLKIDSTQRRLISWL
jgi:ribonuclease HII